MISVCYACQQSYDTSSLPWPCILCLLAAFRAFISAMSPWILAILCVLSPRSSRSLSYNWQAASTNEPAGAFCSLSSVRKLSILRPVKARMSARWVLYWSKVVISSAMDCSLWTILECEQFNNSAISLVVSPLRLYSMIDSSGIPLGAELGMSGNVSAVWFMLLHPVFVIV